MAGGDCRERGLQVGKRLHAVDLAAVDQRGDAAFVVTGEERILPIEGDGTHQAFAPVGVDLDAPVGQGGLQPLQVGVDAGRLFARPGFAGDVAALCLRSVPEGGHQRRGSGLTGGETQTGRDAADVGLDGMELSDAAQIFGGDVESIAVEDLLEFAPREWACRPFATVGSIGCSRCSPSSGKQSPRLLDDPPQSPGCHRKRSGRFWHSRPRGRGGRSRRR